MARSGNISGHNASNTPKGAAGSWWQRLVSGLLAFISSMGGLAFIAAVVYFAAASTANFFPFQPHPVVTPTTSPSGSPSISSSPENFPSQPPETCVAGSISISGSTAFQPLALKAALAYMSRCKKATIEVSGGDSAFGLGQLPKAVADHSQSARTMIAMYDGLPSGTAGLKAYPVGVLIFSIVANTMTFTSGSIATTQLYKIFVKPGETGVVAVGRRAGSGTRFNFVTKVLGFKSDQVDLPKIAPAPDNCPSPSPNGQAVSFTSCTELSTDNLLEFVSDTPNAIGYAQVYGLPNYPQVGILDINGSPPNLANVLNGSYPYWAVEHLYAVPNPTPLVTDFLDFLPGYLASNPVPNFSVCAPDLQTLERDC